MMRVRFPLSDLDADAARAGWIGRETPRES